MTCRSSFLVALGHAAVSQASGTGTRSGATANPIRKIVNMLEAMKTETAEAIAKEKESFEKFMCYCEKEEAKLVQSIPELQATIDQSTAKADALAGEAAGLKQDIATNKEERKHAEAKLKAVTKDEEDTLVKCDKDLAEQKASLDQINAAVEALSKRSASGAFLQTSAAAALKTLILKHSTAIERMDLSDQQELMSFAQSGSTAGSGGFGEILGTLKTMSETFAKDLEESTEECNKSKKGLADLKKSLQESLGHFGKTIEVKQSRLGDVAVQHVESKNTVANNSKQLEEDQTALTELKKACKDKAAAWDIRQKDAADEIMAIMETVKILDSDEARDQFSKRDSTANKPDAQEAVLLQTSARRNEPAAVVANLLNQSDFSRTPVLAMLSYSAKQSLRAGLKKTDMTKIMELIDGMIVSLKEEEKSESEERDSCTADFHDNGMERKDIDNSLASASAEIENVEAQKKEKEEKRVRLETAVAEAKEAMAKATSLRQSENAEFKNNVVEIEATKKILAKAEEKLRTRMEENRAGKIFQMFANIKNDLNNEQKDVTTAEQNSQEDYQNLANDLKDSIKSKNEEKTDIDLTLANLEESGIKLEESLGAAKTDDQNNRKSKEDLHKRCDDLLKNFEERRATRETEKENLTKAKQVLAGGR